MAVSGCIQSQEKLESSEPRKATVRIDFEDFEVDFNNEMKTTWTLENEYWEYITEPDEEQTSWIFENVPSYNISVYGFLMDSARIGGFEVKTKEHSYGLMVVSIGGIENGIDGHYWQYYVNGEYGSVASDKQEVTDYDVIEWRYQGNPFE